MTKYYTWDSVVVKKEKKLDTISRAYVEMPFCAMLTYGDGA